MFTVYATRTFSAKVIKIDVATLEEAEKVAWSYWKGLSTIQIVKFDNGEYEDIPYNNNFGCLA